MSPRSPLSGASHGTQALPRARRRRPAMAGTALATVGVLLTAGCAQGGPGEDADSADLVGQPAGTVKKDALNGVRMTFVSYGGGMQDGQEGAFVKPFAKDSGADVLTDGPTDPAKIKAQVNSKNVLWDVVDTTPWDAAANCETLYQKLDYKIINTSQLPRQTPESPCMVPSLIYGYGLYYNADKYGDNPPTTWADFFDTEKFPGKRAVDGRPTPTPGIFEAALLADGVGPSKLYPLDTKRALRKWDDIKSDLTYWKTGAQQTQIAQSGQADMIMAWSGRIYEANANGANFRPVWNNSFTLYDVFAVPKGSKNTKAAMGLINYALGEEQQTRQSEYTSYAPVNVNSKPTLSPQAQKLDPTQEKVLNQSITPDFTYWGQNRDKLSTAWTDWLNR
ncbi:ABC transporter substrate-binding protein [Streptomyces sp. NPDC059679]|uniref:ABC transporter substrate-binding protein n=1 Tax=Streptomyces sp. NPDC059679 TaxID=3346903 RepID=UPI00367A3791